MTIKDYLQEKLSEFKQGHEYWSDVIRTEKDQKRLDYANHNIIGFNFMIRELESMILDQSLNLSTNN